MNIKKNLLLVLCIASTVSAGIASGLGTINEITTWYAGLVKPSFTPPNWIFGPVWTVVYTFIGIVFYRVITLHCQLPQKPILTLFIFQLLLNLAWSTIFFVKHQMLLGGIDISLLWITIVILMVKFKQANDKISLWLFVPYLVWISFASLLNWSIYYLNG